MQRRGGVPQFCSRDEEGTVRRLSAIKAHEGHRWLYFPLGRGTGDKRRRASICIIVRSSLLTRREEIHSIH